MRTPAAKACSPQAKQDGNYFRVHSALVRGRLDENRNIAAKPIKLKAPVEGSGTIAIEP